MSKLCDLTGNRYGKLTAVALAGMNKFGHARWLCLCECGDVHTVDAANLKFGSVKSCGCMHHVRTHGKSYRTEHYIWRGIKQRCLNPDNPGYADYGKRGITICAAWVNSFEVFLSDMGDRPSLKHTVERVDNDKGYYPDNCIWATRDTQSRNTRRSHRVTINGTTKCFYDWLREFGIAPSSVRARIASGMSEVDAITAPKKR